jgi:hypothetical protein
LRRKLTLADATNNLLADGLDTDGDGLDVLDELGDLLELLLAQGLLSGGTESVDGVQEDVNALTNGDQGRLNLDHDLSDILELEDLLCNANVSRQRYFFLASPELLRTDGSNLLLNDVLGLADSLNSLNEADEASNGEVGGKSRGSNGRAERKGGEGESSELHFDEWWWLSGWML